MDNVTRNIKPLYINFERDVFENPKENYKFIDSLKKMKAADVSVLHDNPYIFLSLVDYYDGSVYDIIILDTHRITIVAQMSSSHQALKRLINHIFDNFEEGNITEGL